jgi:hypothetical protein
LRKSAYRDEIREASVTGRSAGWRLGVAIVAVIAFLGLVGVGIWYFKVATSDVKGAGDATRQVNSAPNRLQAQARWTDLYNGIQADDRKINTLAQTYALSPSEMNLVNLTGAQNVCDSNIAAYNALQTNQLFAPFQPPLLPIQVGSDPTTDCRPDLQPTPPAPSPSA